MLVKHLHHTSTELPLFPTTGSKHSGQWHGVLIQDRPTVDRVEAPMTGAAVLQQEEIEHFVSTSSNVCLPVVARPR
jgi:hypothetical protein